MATILMNPVAWHDGESKMHRPAAGLLMRRCPLLAIWALDQEGRPWCSLWGGEEGFATPASGTSFDIKTPVRKTYDPVVKSLLLDSTGDSGKLVSFLAVDLENRRRVKLFGKITAGNCPKYLNAKRIVPAPLDPKLISETPQLHPYAIDLLDHADCLFNSSHGTHEMDTNIRGGPPGFVRVVTNQPSGAVIVYPEYTGNRLYQTLGNLQTNPLAGYVFPDFETGNALFVTGKTEILIGEDASSVLPRSNIVARLTVTESRFVKKALSFRGEPRKTSPYNPSVRYLTTEKMSAAALGPRKSYVTATMIKKEIITPSIGRFRFRISNLKEAGAWTPGHHMMDDDPTSLNDDWVRTFTVSSSPGHGLANREFEITVRKHGNVTRYLFQASDRAGLEVPMQGFSGDFRLTEQTSDDILPFIAGGIGVTPVLAHLPVIDIKRLRLFWSISIKDIALVSNMFKRFPELPISTTLFITGLSPQDGQNSTELEVIISTQDLDLSLAEEWYFCRSPVLKVDIFEHNTTDPSNPQTHSTTHRRRPDLSTFFATLSEISSDEARTRQHAVPVPRDVSAAFYSLAEALNIMRREGEGGGASAGATDEAAETESFPTLNPDGTPIRVHGDDLLAQMIQTLLRDAEMPPTEVEGVTEEFCDVLDRVPRSSLKPSQSCPICSNPFLDDKYPLVVRLPCHPTHLFDLECVRPWLRLRGTCPLDRTNFAKQERDKVEKRKKIVEEDEEEEWDGMYG
ncbi:hypothetical protein BDV12DRAFT_182647 [Aspergillus spectabilis]